MIHYVEHQDIDKQRWDQCNRSAWNPVIYAQSWYLDLAHPGWDALVLGDYRAVFPLPWRRKFSVYYLFTPFFIQQLGIISLIPPDQAILDDFLQAVPRKFRHANLNLNAGNEFVPETGSLWWYTNLLIDLRKPYELIRKRYNTNTLRNLRKAEAAGLEIHEQVDPHDVITLFRGHQGMTHAFRDHDYDRLENIMAYALYTGDGYCVGAGQPGESYCAAAYFLKGMGRLVFLFSGNSAEGLERSAMFLLIDHVLKKFNGQSLFFDFEGSNNPDLARFYRGFGAKEERYPCWKMNRLPWFGKLAVDIRQRMKDII